MDALITGHHPEDHNSFDYEFVVGEKKFSGTDSPSQGDFSVGQHATVYYDPVDPSRNALGDFEDSAMTMGIPLGFITFIMIVVATFIWARRAGRI